jgi:hypothetical protein
VFRLDIRLYIRHQDRELNSEGSSFRADYSLSDQTSVAATNEQAVLALVSGTYPSLTVNLHAGGVRDAGLTNAPLSEFWDRFDMAISCNMDYSTALTLPKLQHSPRQYRGNKPRRGQEALLASVDPRLRHIDVFY